MNNVAMSSCSSADLATTKKLHHMKFFHLEFIFFLIVTVDPWVFVCRALVLVVTNILPQNPQPPFLLVLQMFNMEIFKWKQLRKCLPQTPRLFKSLPMFIFIVIVIAVHNKGWAYQFQRAGILLCLIFDFFLH